jgi:hypothetical protein
MVALPMKWTNVRTLKIFDERLGVWRKCRRFWTALTNAFTNPNGKRAARIAPKDKAFPRFQDHSYNTTDTMQRKQSRRKPVVTKRPRKKQKQTKTLPNFENGKPRHDFASRARLRPNDVRTMCWNSEHEKARKVVAPHMYEVGIAPILTEKIIHMCEKDGIMAMARRLIAGKERLSRGIFKKKKLGGNEWTVQSPTFSSQSSNMHWLSPGKAAHDSMLHLLSDAGFDHCLQAIGKALRLNRLTVHQFTFLCVSKCEQADVHTDTTLTGGKAYNLLIPLQLSTDKNTPAELEILGDEPHFEGKIEYRDVGSYKYETSTAILFGDDALHATDKVEFSGAGNFRLMLSILIGEVDNQNLLKVVDNFSENAYRLSNTQLRKVSHWSKNDSSVRLPTSESE